MMFNLVVTMNASLLAVMLHSAQSFDIIYIFKRNFLFFKRIPTHVTSLIYHN